MEAGNNLAVSPVMLKPGVDAAYSHGWKHLWKYFGVLLLVVIIYGIISMAINIIGWTAGRGPILSTIGAFYGLLISGPLGYGANFVYLKAAREEKVEVGDLFEPFRRNYWHAVLANFLVGIIIGFLPVLMSIILYVVIEGRSESVVNVVMILFALSLVLAIFLICKLMFVPFLVVDKKVGAIQAIKESWRMTKGYAGKIFLMLLLGIPIVIAGLICFGVGVIVSFMWIAMAFASLYYAVSLEREAAEQPAGI